MWNIDTSTAITQLIAHDREVYGARQLDAATFEQDHVSGKIDEAIPTLMQRRDVAGIAARRIWLE